MLIRTSCCLTLECGLTQREADISGDICIFIPLLQIFLGLKIDVTQGPEFKPQYNNKVKKKVASAMAEATGIYFILFIFFVGLSFGSGLRV
jgi:hypothetical protein